MSDDVLLPDSDLAVLSGSRIRVSRRRRGLLRRLVDVLARAF